MFSSTVDFHRTRVEGGKKRQIRGQLIHRSCLWIIDFSIQQCDSPALSPAPLRSDPPTLKRFKDVGVLASTNRCTVSSHRCCGSGSQSGITVQHARTELLRQLVLICLWLFVLFVFLSLVGWLDAARGCRLSRRPRSPARSPQP